MDDGSGIFHLFDPDGDFQFWLALPFAYPLPRSVLFEDQGLNPLPATVPTGSRHRGQCHRAGEEPPFRTMVRAAQPDGFADRVVWTTGIAQDPGLSEIANDDLQWPNEPEASDELHAARRGASDQVVAAPQAFTMYVGFDVRMAPSDDVPRAAGRELRDRSGARDRVPRRADASPSDVPDHPAQLPGLRAVLSVHALPGRERLVGAGRPTSACAGARGRCRRPPSGMDHARWAPLRRSRRGHDEVRHGPPQRDRTSSGTDGRPPDRYFGTTTRGYRPGAAGPPHVYLAG